MFSYDSNTSTTVHITINTGQNEQSTLNYTSPISDTIENKKKTIQLSESQMFPVSTYPPITVCVRKHVSFLHYCAYVAKHRSMACI